MLTGCHSANAIAGGLLGQVKSLELASVRNDEFDTTILMRVLCSILCQARSLGRGIGEADRMGIEQIDNRSVADVADDEEIRVESFALPCVRVRDAERPFFAILVAQPGDEALSAHLFGQHLGFPSIEGGGILAVVVPVQVMLPECTRLPRLDRVREGERENFRLGGETADLIGTLGGSPLAV